MPQARYCSEPVDLENHLTSAMPDFSNRGMSNIGAEDEFNAQNQRDADLLYRYI